VETACYKKNLFALNSSTQFSRADEISVLN